MERKLLIGVVAIIVIAIALIMFFLLPALPPAAPSFTVKFNEVKRVLENNDLNLERFTKGQIFEEEFGAPKFDYSEEQFTKLERDLKNFQQKVVGLPEMPENNALKEVVALYIDAVEWNRKKRDLFYRGYEFNIALPDDANAVCNKMDQFHAFMEEDFNLTMEAIDLDQRSSEIFVKYSEEVDGLDEAMLDLNTTYYFDAHEELSDLLDEVDEICYLIFTE